MTRQQNKFDPLFVPIPDISNTAAVIVSYFPGSHFEQRLDELADQFDAVFWVDNTPQQPGDEHQSPGATVRCLATGENAGLAAALNRGCRAALDAEYGWVVTFDQDSQIVAGFLEQHIESWRQAEEPPFMLGCNYTDSPDKESPRFMSGSYVRNCRTVITSGSLMCLPAWRALGEFRGDYFIDGVDHEICLRARKNGLVIARHGRALMQHQIGETSVRPGFLPYRQPAGRMYYSTRNGIRNVIDFASSEPIWALRKIVAIAWEGLMAVLLGPDRLSKLKAIARGLADGVRGNMGPARTETAV